MKKILTILLITFVHLYNYSQEIIPLWKTVPNQISSSEKEISKRDRILHISNVQNPSISVFLTPDSLNTKKAVIICPGGGYGNLSFEYEGTEFATWLNSKGINAFVLKYRLPKSKSIIEKHKAPLQDIQRAIRIVRFNSEKWNIDSTKIGLLGFSAGGHLVSTAGTHFNEVIYTKSDTIDSVSAKPNFMGLIYPVISMRDSITHNGSRFNLLGKNPTDSLKKHFSNELQVKENTPPTFLVHATDDKAVPVNNSILFYQALTKKNIPVELHIYPFGGHGFAFAETKKPLNNWPNLFLDWLGEH
ncbi:alpha/beta hydrolase [Lutibacter sp. TH_r2]|uniref:alpha/beta hydrolase n=1 Tax=Lutibacter sp. TH_r2 TaxID=3082083 RepID=UPI0029553AC3|nr:alpha/beta hydrolase [Lutibacter sp. TH_r2]MDV7185864.1 alpha/beta hydrolase [Lutibacter sp. TH_r2]